MPHRKAKRPRGSRGARPGAPCIRDGQQAPYHDLFVPLPKSSSTPYEHKVESRLMIRHIADRLGATGYTTMSLTHTIFGRPKVGEDEADVVLPASLYATGKSTSATFRASKRRKEKGNKQSNQPFIQILRRLHAVVENVSDVGLYATSTSAESAPVQNLMNEYDLISISPRNDATFQAACVSDADIITLDYTSGRGGVQLPFRIRPADIRGIVARGAALELPYSLAVLNVHQRKALVQTAAALQMASVGVRPKPHILLSSGDRTATGESDVGAMALRSPGDLINLLQTVLMFDPKTSIAALGSSGSHILEKAKLRRMSPLGERDTKLVSFHFYEESGGTAPVSREIEKSLADRDEGPVSRDTESEQYENAEGVEDGFIKMF